MESVIPLSAKRLDDPSSSSSSISSKVAPASLPRSESSAKTIQISMNNNKTENIINEHQSTDDATDINLPVLLNTFISRKKRYRVFYNAGIIVWERFKSEKGI